jgi:predicted TIM-barrel fold metal-dependent hydrolase
VAAIYLPALGINLGNRWYWPIYREAAALGLPIALHVHGTEFVMNGAPMGAPAGQRATPSDSQTFRSSPAHTCRA